MTSTHRIPRSAPRALATLCVASTIALLATACGGGDDGFDRRALTIVVPFLGAGSVQSQPAGVDCGITCRATFERNTTLTLTAVPATGQRFVGWSGACTGTANPCTLKLSGDRTVSAAFAPVAGSAGEPS